MVDRETLLNHWRRQGERLPELSERGLFKGPTSSKKKVPEGTWFTTPKEKRGKRRKMGKDTISGKQKQIPGVREEERSRNNLKRYVKEGFFNSRENPQARSELEHIFYWGLSEKGRKVLHDQWVK